MKKSLGTGIQKTDSTLLQLIMYCLMRMGRKRDQFLFYKLVINNIGVVAGSFFIDQRRGVRKFNQNPWFWWSFEQGLYI